MREGVDYKDLKIINKLKTFGLVHYSKIMLEHYFIINQLYDTSNQSCTTSLLSFNGVMKMATRLAFAGSSLTGFFIPNFVV